MNEGTANAARKFLNFLAQPEQQAVFVQHGFRPMNKAVDLQSVQHSPWNQNIPGIEVKPPGRVIPPPNPDILREINRLWERAS